MVQSSLSNINKTLKKLEELGFKASVTAKEKHFFEEVVIITAYT
jgi:release factor glutamine methyltransferase